MMPIYLEQRFHMLLNLAKEARYTEVARENVVAANEMVDTLFAVGMLNRIESMEYRALCAAVKVMIERKEKVI